MNDNIIMFCLQMLDSSPYLVSAVQYKHLIHYCAA